MTVIATFSINACPILMGDLLISGDESPQSSLNVPTIGDIDQIFPQGSGYLPTSLNQKLSIMNDNLAIAWAGTKISANVIFRQLLKECKKNPIGASGICRPSSQISIKTMGLTWGLLALVMMEKESSLLATESVRLNISQIDMDW